MLGVVRAPARRTWTILLASLVAALALVWSAVPAHADEDQGNRAITRYDVVAVANTDGTIDVTLDFDFDFADTPGHGPFLTIVTRQEIEGDPDHYRELRVFDVTATSPSGAPAGLREERADAGLAIYVGDESIDDVQGVQHYVVTYSLAGLPNSGVGAAGEDEIYWNVVGGGFEIPLENVTVTVTGPAGTAQAACYVGRVGSHQTCAGYKTDGEGTVFRQGRLNPGEGMSVITSYPGGTFGGVQPILVPRRTLANSVGLTPATGGIAGALTLLGVGLVGHRARQRGRDEQYLGLTPGLFPTSVDTPRTGPRGKHPITVQFTPPAGVRPGEMGTLADEVADPRDVTATIVDLAVQGYLTIREVPHAKDRDKPDWELVQKIERADPRFMELPAYERTLLRGVFEGSRTSVRLSELKSSFAPTMGEAQDQLYDEMTHLGWFRKSPKAVRARWFAAGIVLVVVGVLAAIVLGIVAGLGVLGLPLIVLGVVVAALAKAAPARTADGTAVLAQSLGFKRYLETAEANQIRFEEGEDV
ncbi:MAG: DUF2207 domain-containing protein, partial [Actinomycetales bacterium]|nr:DUF2207 domain-containing protein [Actinomycetales bacterium]